MMKYVIAYIAIGVLIDYYEQRGGRQPYKPGPAIVIWPLGLVVGAALKAGATI